MIRSVLTHNRVRLELVDNGIAHHEEFCYIDRRIGQPMLFQPGVFLAPSGEKDA